MPATRALRILTLGVTSALLLTGCAVNEREALRMIDPHDASALVGTVRATGASSQMAAQEAWMAGFQTDNPRATINYEPTGSGTGRANFQAGGIAFVGSDRAFTDDEIAAGDFRACASDELVEVPLYISPVVVAFHLEGIDSLDLSPETIARIFSGQITRWNDAAITEDNPEVALPDLAVSPVHRSDPSGTQETFTHYLARTAGEAWPYGASDKWPITGGEAAQGISGVKQALSSGRGTIGFLDASQAEGLGTSRLLVAGEYISYSPGAASALVETSPLREGRSAGDLVFDIDPATASAGAYPLALVSYLIGCEQYTDAATAALVQGYFRHMISAEGQQAASVHAGSSPISAGLRDKALAAVDLIRVAPKES